MLTVGPGVNEIRIHVEGEHRIFYVARLRHAIYVLHPFRKKTFKWATRTISLRRSWIRTFPPMFNSRTPALSLSD